MAKEKRLIDANALVKIAEKRCGVINIKHIDEAPTVDAVEVVRCRDCKHWKIIDSLNPHWECQIFYGLHEHGYPTNADDFCSYGERREGE